MLYIIFSAKIDRTFVKKAKNGNKLTRDQLVTIY